MYDLWDVESRKYFGSFPSEDAALRLVAGLLKSNGDDFADVLELGASEDEFGEHNLTGAALVERVRTRLADAATEAVQVGTSR